MIAQVERDGTVTATWNMQTERLEAPPSTLTGRRHYLPCELCADLLPVAWNIVALTCCGTCLEAARAVLDAADAEREHRFLAHGALGRPDRPGSPCLSNEACRRMPPIPAARCALELAEVVIPPGGKLTQIGRERLHATGSKPLWPHDDKDVSPKEETRNG